MKFTVQLKKARTAQGLTQKQVADYIGVSKQTITAYEAGTREPDLMKLVLLAEVLKTTPDFLLGREKAPAQNEQELSEIDLQLLALPEDVKQTVLLLVTQVAAQSAPTVRVSELTARRIQQAIPQDQDSQQQIGDQEQQTH